MHSKRVLSFLAVLVLSLFVPAGANPPKAEPNSFELGSMRISVTNDRGPRRSKFGPPAIRVVVENTSETDFVVFAPRLLYFVNETNDQRNIRAIAAWSIAAYPATTDIKVAPGARMTEDYALSGVIVYPARLYYDETLLAVLE